jgi:hypothetical protein
VWEAKIACEPATLTGWFAALGLDLAQIGLESSLVAYAVTIGIGGTHWNGRHIVALMHFNIHRPDALWLIHMSRVGPISLFARRLAGMPFPRLLKPSWHLVYTAILLLISVAVITALFIGSQYRLRNGRLNQHTTVNYKSIDPHIQGEANGGEGLKITASVQHRKEAG